MKSVKFVLAIIMTASLLSSATALSFGATFIPSPREQVDNGTSPAKVICKEGLKLVIRASSNSAACVLSSSYDKMIQMGWAKTLADYKTKPQMSNIGEVKTVRAVPMYFDTGIRESKPEIVTTYNYVFEACAKSTVIRSPEVLIISDSETKSTILSQSIPANSCQLSTTIVKANDPNSIKANLVKNTDLAIIVGDLESKVKNIQEKLSVEKKELAELVKEDPQSGDYNKKISEKTNNIVDLRKELDIARAELQKNQYALIVGTKTPPIVKPQLSNKEIPPKEVIPKDYAHVNKIKTVPQFVDAGRLKSDPVTSAYNFVFEVCAGKNNIQFPEIMVRSDSEIKSIKLSESLDSYSCQTSSTSLKAADQNSIQGTIITTGDISQMLKQLESKVTSLQENIAKDKKTLGMLVTQNPPPDDLEKQVSEITDRIVTQRNELNQVKQELISIKYMVSE